MKFSQKAALLFLLIGVIFGVVWARNSEWIKVDARGVPPLEKEGHSCDIIARKLYVYGGRSSITSWHNSMHILDLQTDKWSEVKLPSSAPKLTGHSMNLINGKFYIFGGRAGVFSWSNKLYTFDITTEQIEEVQPKGTPPSERSGHASVVINGRLFVYGGFNGNDRLGDMFMYDPETNEWNTVDQSGTGPGKIDGHRAIAIDNTMYIFGGVNQQKKLITDVYTFDAMTSTWASIAKAKGRASHTATLVNNRFVYIFGGIDQAKARLNDVRVFDIDNNRWVDHSVSGDVIVPSRQGHCSIVHDSRMVIFGGSVSWTTYYNDVFALDTTPELTKRMEREQFNEVELSTRIEQTTDSARMTLKLIKDTDADVTVAVEREYEADLKKEEEDPIFKTLPEKIAIWGNIGDLYRELQTGAGDEQSKRTQSIHLKVSNITSLKKQREDLKLDLEDRIKSIEEKLDDLKTQEELVAENQRKRAELDKMHSDTSNNVKRIESQYDQLLNEQHTIDFEIQKLEQRKGDLQSSLDRLRNVEEKISTTYKEYENQEQSLNSELMEIRRKKSDASSHKEELSERHGSLSRNVTAIERQLANLKSLEDLIEETKNKLEKSKDTYQDYRLSYMTLVARIQQVVNEKPGGNLPSLEFDDSWLDDLLDSHKKKLLEELSKAKAEEKTVYNQLQSIINNLDTLASEELKIKNQLGRIKSLLSNRKDETQKRLKERINVETEHKKALSEYNQVTFKKSTLDDDIHKKKRALNRAKTAAQEELDKLLKAQEAEDKAKRDLAVIKGSLEREYDDLTNAHHRVKNLGESIATLRREVAAVNFEFENYRVNVNDLRDKIKQEVERAESELRQQIKQLKSRVAELEQEVVKCKKEEE